MNECKDRRHPTKASSTSGKLLKRSDDSEVSKRQRIMIEGSDGSLGGLIKSQFRGHSRIGFIGYGALVYAHCGKQTESQLPIE